MSMCLTIIPNAIALLPKPTPNIWIGCFRRRSRSACFISPMPLIQSIALNNNLEH
ncbi:hypothetical protein [Dendronalium sp. ChiSLP03b]|uniref:hypothetical protein n=1 Tax=Dendronalium sp. ChiSLP03b TaxID=3075381 RepID=UPI002ADB31C0|nr:hypothetical protein [Dendronalium sp. ChiSLP03b]